MGYYLSALSYISEFLFFALILLLKAYDLARLPQVLLVELRGLLHEFLLHVAAPFVRVALPIRLLLLLLCCVSVVGLFCVVVHVVDFGAVCPCYVFLLGPDLLV